MKSMLLESVINMLVSSAKRTILLCLGIIFGRSFIYSRKSRGPELSLAEHHVLSKPNLNSCCSCYGCYYEVLLSDICWLDRISFEF